MSNRKIASNYLWTPEGFVRNSLVTVGDDGRILSVAVCPEPDRSDHTEFYAGILTPGFINAHCHLELSYLKSTIPEGCGFSGFARAMGEVRGRFTEQERREAMDAADAAMNGEGVVAVGDVSNGDTSFEVKRASGMIYHTFVEFFGLRNGSAEHLQPLLNTPNTSLTPHSTYSVQDAPFRAICRDGDAPLSIHFMESPAETELFDGRGTLYEWYERMGFPCDFLHYETPSERIVRSIPASRSVILVHNCCVTAQDVERILAHFSAPVFWCLCPRSNHFISRLKPPVGLLRAQNASICLGTDSLASNHSLSLFSELMLLSDVPLAELLGWATLNGAKALGMERELGTVEAGKCCGLNVLSGVDYEQMKLTALSRVTKIL